MTVRPITVTGSTEALIAELRKRVYDLERRYVPAVGLRVGIPYVFHHMADPLVVETSDKLGIPIPGVLQVWCAALTTAASSGDTVVELLVNGTVVSTITIAAGGTFARLDVGAELAVGSTIQTNLTAVGDGALGLVCCALQLAPVV